ncbi:MAG: substrate-binding domain-containing protein [Planctomycetota bacterium]|nr:substrate-binding domain-containing protein [Planctomycetota bacterium]
MVWPAQIDAKSPFPLPVQVRRILEGEMEAGRFPAGSRLPPERSLMERFRVSRKTIRAALEMLEDEGRILRHVGRGTFVREGRRVQDAARMAIAHVGVVFFKYTDPAQDPLTLDLLGGIHEVLQAENCLATTFGLSVQPGDHFKKLVADVRGTPLDAIVLMPESVERAYDALSAHAPVLQAGYAFTDRGWDYVGGDLFGGMRQALDKLARLGHRHIAYITTETKEQAAQTSIPALKIASFREALAQVGGGRLRGEVVYASRYDEFFESRPRPTAVFTAQTNQAKTVLKEARERGVAIPRELSLISFDDGFIGTHTHPPFSGLKVLTADMGRAAARAVVELVNGQAARPIQRILPAELHLRETTTRAP